LLAARTPKTIGIAMIAINTPRQDASVNGRVNRVLRVMAGLDPAMTQRCGDAHFAKLPGVVYFAESAP